MKIIRNLFNIRREANRKAAALKRGDGLSVLLRVCQSQKTISTRIVLEHLERTHEFMKDCAIQMEKLTDELPPDESKESQKT